MESKFLIPEFDFPWPSLQIRRKFRRAATYLKHTVPSLSLSHAPSIWFYFCSSILDCIAFENSGYLLRGILVSLLILIEFGITGKKNGCTPVPFYRSSLFFDIFFLLISLVWEAGAAWSKVFFVIGPWLTNLWKGFLFFADFDPSQDYWVHCYVIYKGQYWNLLVWFAVDQNIFFSFWKCCCWVWFLPWLLG